GNGVDELTYADYGGAHLWHLDAGGQLRHVDIDALLAEQWPNCLETQSWISWNPWSRCLAVTGYVPLPGETDLAANAFRDLYFDGEKLLLYRDTRTQTDHVREGVSAPEDVLAAAKAAALANIEEDTSYMPGAAEN